MAQQASATNDERPFRKRGRPAKFHDFEVNFDLSKSSELGDESEQEGAARALKRQKKNEKSEADKKAANRTSKKKWRENKIRQNPDHFKKQFKDWRDKKIRQDPDHFRQKNKDWRDKNKNYFKDWKNLTLL